MDIDSRIAMRVRQLRAESGLALEALAGRSGVSRSMISLIERGESSPTAVLLERLAAGLGVPLASLFDAPSAPADPLSRRKDQAEWRDPGSGYVRRNVSPGGFPSPIHIVEVLFPAILDDLAQIDTRCSPAADRSLQRRLGFLTSDLTKAVLDGRGYLGRLTTDAPVRASVASAVASLPSVRLF